MNEQRQLEEMGKLDGYEFQKTDVVGNFVFTKNGNGYYLLDYLHDYNDVHKVLDKLDWQELHRFVDILNEMFIETKDTLDVQLNNSYKATPAQMTEAILKATEKWEEE
jgi:hypothetical protein